MKKILAALLMGMFLATPAHAWMVVVEMNPTPQRPDLTQEEILSGLEAYGDVIAVLDDSWTVDPPDPRMGAAECWNWPWSVGGSLGCIEVTGVTYEEAEAFALDRSVTDADDFVTISRDYFVMIDSMTGQAKPQLLNNGVTSQTWAKMKNWFCSKSTGLTPGGKSCP